MRVISEPFVWGLALGLLIAGFVWKSGWTASRTLKKEAARLAEEQRTLQAHLNTHLKITASGNDQTQREIEDLRRQNENLRVTVSALQQKPGRAELRQWQITEAAAARMRESAPGFAPAWEQALREATRDMEASENGISKFIRRVLPGAQTTDRPEPQEQLPLMDREKRRDE